MSMKKSLPYLLLILWAACLPRIASATDITADITVDTTWDPAGSPYIITMPISVASSATLTVAPGTTVKFSPGTELTILGTLHAIGTAVNGILFDSNVPTPAPGDWIGINVNDAGVARFEYCTIRYSSGNISSNGGSGLIRIENSTLSNSMGHGIFVGLGGVDLTVANNIISNNGTDGIILYYSFGNQVISGNTVSYNSGRGIYAEGTGTDPRIQNNVIAKNNIGVHASTGAMNPGNSSFVTGNSIFQNNTYGVLNDDVGVTVNAIDNWWGSSGGPLHPGNPPGSGNAVSDYVTYTPYRSFPTFPEAVASFAPEYHDFKRVVAGTTSAPQLITVVNISNQTLEFGTLSFSGQNPGGFQKIDDLCSGASIPSGASCSVKVTFTPGAKLTYSARLDFPAGGTSILPLYSVTLTGTGYTPVTLPFIDDFTGNSSSSWTVSLPQPDGVDFSVKPDWMRLTSYRIYSPIFDPFGTTSTPTYNFFSLALPVGTNKLMVTAKLFIPTFLLDKFPQGGIILLPEHNSQFDSNNYIRTQYRGSTINTFNFQTTTAVNGVLTNSDSTFNPTVNDVWVRIIKRGNNYQSLYSTDGIAFTAWRTDTLQQEVAYAGLFAYRESGAASTTAVDFDFFSIKALPTISAPSTFDFGSVPYGSTAMQTLTIINTGSGPLTVTSLTLSGTDAGLFGINQTLPFSIAAGATFDLPVTMATTTLGASFSASLTIGSDDIDTPAASVSLSGAVISTATTISIDFLGTGGGKVTYNSTDCTNDCTVIANSGTSVTFTFAPDDYSLFNGWGGSCSGNGVCSFTAPGTTGGVTATFDRDSAHSVKIEPGSFFPSITGTGGAYASAAVSGSTTIKLWGASYSELLTFDQGKDILLDGGYDGTFTTNSSGMTTVQGAMTVVIGATGGRVDVRNITIKAQQNPN